MTRLFKLVLPWRFQTLNLYVVVFDWSIDWHMGEDEGFVDMINHVP